ncbi:hypothetical protein M728_000839 [Ensifer sp. WSM1721]
MQPTLLQVLFPEEQQGHGFRSKVTKTNALIREDTKEYMQ